MPLQQLKDYLDNNHVKYDVLAHTPAIAAQQIAETVHLPGQKLAKTVMVKLDGKMAMVVISANYKVNLDYVKMFTTANKVELASESEFKDKFPGCETGGMPPFGNLFGIDVYVDDELSKQQEIAFNAGTHNECVKLSYADFARLVKPKVLS